MANRALIGLRRLAAVGAVAALALGAGLYGFMKVDPVGYRSAVFQPVREAALFVRELDVPGRWGDIETLHVPEPETIRIPAAGADSVEIAAALYRPTRPARDAAVVVQHGSYPWGRKEGLMRLLAARLSENGWLVIAPDARGFGESGDPADVEDPRSWETASDLRRVIDYLRDTAGARSDGIFVLGHSMGANHALEGGLPDERVKALVLVGPGRFTEGQDLMVPNWERARFAADRNLAKPISQETALHAYSLGNIRLLAQSELAVPDHKPILLIDGEKEGDSALQYLRNIVAELKGPIEYHTLPGTGHYCGVRSFYGAETVYYRPDLFEPFFELVTDFLGRQLSLVEELARDSRSGSEL